MDRNNPLVSIIIPAYNAKKSLPRCLKSILSQEYHNIEVIIINDGSTDTTEKVCAKYAGKDDRIKVYSQDNKGIAAARNKGLRRAAGKYVMFVDADDELLPWCIEKCLNIVSGENVDIVKFSYVKTMGKARSTYSYQSQAGIILDKDTIKNEIFPTLFKNYDFTNVWSMMIKSDIAKSIRFSPYRVGEDFLYSSKCLGKVKDLFILDEPLYKYRVNFGSATHGYGVEKLTDEIKVLQKIATITKNNKGLNSRIADAVHANIANCAISCNYKKYLEFLDKLSNALPKETTEIVRQMRLKSSYHKLRLRSAHKVIIGKVCQRRNK